MQETKNTEIWRRIREKTFSFVTKVGEKWRALAASCAFALALAFMLRLGGGLAHFSLRRHQWTLQKDDHIKI